MNAGLANLVTLKAHLLAEALREGTDYDTALTTIGLGVAAQFDLHCNRKFKRVEGATFICSADRDHCFLDRYPVESVTTVELKTDHTTGWVAQTSLLENSDLESGHLFWGGPVGTSSDRLRFTFIGGYWWDQTAAGTDSLPENATALPADLKHAWILQCQHTWAHTDKLGVGIAAAPDRQADSEKTALLDVVKEILAPYRRFTVA